MEKVLVSGCDIDGIPRGKILSLKKFESSKDGFGFCNVIFGWDMHDELYDPKPALAKDSQGFADILAKVDLESKRVCPLTKVPHYLVDFINPNTGEGMAMCPRSLLKRIIKAQPEFIPLAGQEFEFFNFKETPHSLNEKNGIGLQVLTPGMFGYSLQRPSVYPDYFNDIYDQSRDFGIPLECFHTETGPGVYEAAIEYAGALELADRAHHFKNLAKKIGLQHGILPCFMAKPHNNLPGCSGHLHFSLQDQQGNNLFYDESDPQKISSLLRHFVAGILAGLPSIMAILAPNINSYKRLNIHFWAPMTVSYGFEDRSSAIRIITPPVCSPKSTRIEIRVPGADVNTYLACAAILACGYHGIKEKLALPPIVDARECPTLPSSLHRAVDQMAAPDSLARLLLGNEFVDHYCDTRRHEVRLWDSVVTGWEVQRYAEVC